jgi:glycoprotein-N-acetylgalactosamine 3-beta-galactosyltransferase
MLLLAAMVMQGMIFILKYPSTIDGQHFNNDPLLVLDQPTGMASFKGANRSLSSSKPLAENRTVASVSQPAKTMVANKLNQRKPSRQLQMKCNRHPKVLDQIQVANTSELFPKVLCFVMTHAGSHRTKVKAIQRTWGKRCDKLIIASNQTNERLGIVAMKSESSYLGLWGKLNETMQYVWDHYRDEGYDWVFKADDDTYLIVENLKEYLSSPPVKKSVFLKEPVIYGRRYSSPRYRNLAKRKVYFGNPINAEFGERFYEKINKHKPVIYNYGGPGYAMNWPYVEKFLEVMKGPDTVHGTPPEDQAHGVVMAYHDIWPQNTRDQLGRERFHPENPDFMYSMNDTYRRLWDDNHKATGGLSVGPECCSEQSIAFHHMQMQAMLQLEDHLYACRGRE